MNKEKVWVWFKEGSNGGSWVRGFLAHPSEEGGLVIERSDYVTCRVPEWRISFSEPDDINSKPEIPDNAIWKYV